jgi:hypothetical protein
MSSSSSWGGVTLSAFCTLATIWPIIPTPHERWWMWSGWWNENWQEKPKYFVKTWLHASSFTTNPTWPGLGSNLGCQGEKLAINNLIYGTAYHAHYCTSKRKCSENTWSLTLENRCSNWEFFYSIGKSEIFTWLVSWLTTAMQLMHFY